MKEARALEGDTRLAQLARHRDSSRLLQTVAARSVRRSLEEPARARMPAQAALARPRGDQRGRALQGPVRRAGALETRVDLEPTRGLFDLDPAEPAGL